VPAICFLRSSNLTSALKTGFESGVSFDDLKKQIAGTAKSIKVYLKELKLSNSKGGPTIMKMHTKQPGRTKAVAQNGKNRTANKANH